MATTAVTAGMGDVGTGGLPGGGEADLGAALAEGYDLATGETEGAPNAPEATLAPEPPEETTPVDVTGETGQPEAPPTDLPQGWSVSEDGKSLIVPRAEYPRVQSALQYAQQVGQYFTSAQEAQASYQDASAMRQLFNDWSYGNDISLNSVIKHLAGLTQTDPSARASFQRSFVKLAQSAPNYLKQLDPQAYQGMISNMGQSLVQSLYEKAARTGSPDDLLYAQSVEWGLSDGTKYQQTPPQADPQAQARAQFEQQRQEFNARQDAALRRDIADWNNRAVEGAKLAQLDQLIVKQLGDKVKAAYPDVAFNDLIAGIHREVIDTLQQQPEWFTEHRQDFDALVNDYRQTWSQGSPGRGLESRVQSYIQQFLSRAGRLIPSIAQKRVNAATQARLGSTAQRGRSPAPAQRPTVQSTPQTTPPKNGSRAEQFDKEWSRMWSQYR